MYNILSNILLSRLTPYAEEIIGDNQSGFWCNSSTADHTFFIRQIVDKQWEYNEAVHQLCIDIKKAIYLGGRHIEVRECLLSFGAESFVFQFAIHKFKD
jgi:hypothetical protein